MDFLINDYSTTQVLPLEIKSGKDYKEHSALSKFLDEKEYNIHQAIVFSNEPRVWQDKGIWYMPIYYVMFLQKSQAEQIILPRLEMPTIA